MWSCIETEYDEPLIDVIQGMRDLGYTWETIAGALGVSRQTLTQWRKALGMPMNMLEQIHYSADGPTKPTDLRAQELGYKDVTEAVIDMRLTRKMTCKQIAEVLKVHRITITMLTPKELRGEIHNISEEGRLIFRKSIRHAQEAAQKLKSRHPWAYKDRTR